MQIEDWKEAKVDGASRIFGGATLDAAESARDLEESYSIPEAAPRLSRQGLVANYGPYANLRFLVAAFTHLSTLP